jgi:hypothetical protein
MPIETITADSDNKTEAYTLLVMLHTMAVRSTGGVSEWAIKSTATYPDYVMTTVTNGIVDLMAVSIDDHHTYTMQQCEEQ